MRSAEGYKITRHAPPGTGGPRGKRTIDIEEHAARSAKGKAERGESVNMDGETGRDHRESGGNPGSYPWLVSKPVDTYGPLVVALVSTVLPWATVRIPLAASRRVVGLDLLAGQAVAVVVAVAALLSWRMEGWVAAWCRVAGGLAVAGLALFQLRWNGGVTQRTIAAAAESGNPLAEGAASAFSATPGTGLWLALLSGLFLSFVEYYRWQMSSS